MKLDQIIFIAAFSLLGGGLVLAAQLITGNPPAWVGAGARAHPTSAGLFLLFAIACRSAVLFDSLIKGGLKNGESRNKEKQSVAR